MRDLFPERPFLIGVVHLAPTPGSPRYADDLSELLERAVEGSLRDPSCPVVILATHRSYFMPSHRQSVGCRPLQPGVGSENLRRHMDCSELDPITQNARRYSRYAFSRRKNRQA